MARPEKTPRVEVSDRRRITLSLSKEEIVHALRCWASHNLRGAHKLPAPVDFNQIAVTIWGEPDGDAGATIYYDAANEPDLFLADDWTEEDGDVLWWRFPVVEPPYVGSPLASDWQAGLTHWQRIAVPDFVTKEA